MKRRVFAVILLVVTLIAVTAGCGGRPAATRGDLPGVAQPQARYPLVVTDGLGRQVTINARPERVLSFAPSNTETLYGLGLGDRIVGVDQFSDFPAEVAGKPKAGGVTDPNYERIAELAPDLVFTIGIGDDVIKRFEELGMTVVVVQPKTLAETVDSVRFIGRIMDADDAAAELAADMESDIAAIKDRVKDLTDDQRPRVFYEVWPDPLMTAGPGSFINDLIAAAGGRNIAANSDQAWAQFSLEAVVAGDPEVIITTFPGTIDDLKANARSGWQDLTAVRQGRVALIDQNLVSRPGPRLVDALEIFAQAIHPDRFGGR